MGLLKKITPPPQWQLAVAFVGGIALGFAFYLFYISRAWSYASDSPSACINCHIMAPQYATWAHSAHKNAVCNDCHVPQDNFFKKYFFKANDGMRHATLFTLRMESQVIYIKEAGSEAVQANCIRCHEHAFAGLGQLSANGFKSNHTSRRCIDCHRETPHGRVNSLSAVPYAQVPLLKSPVPRWMEKILKNN